MLPMWWSAGAFRLLSSLSQSSAVESAGKWVYGGLSGGAVGRAAVVWEGASLSELMTEYDSLFQQSCAQLRDNHCIVHTGWR
jgi:hypothetical protein